MGAIYLPSDVVIGLAEAATWGTAVLDSAAFAQIKCENPIIVPDVKLHDEPASRGVRYIDVADLVRNEKGSMPKLSISNAHARTNDLALIFYLFFQNVTEGASTPFSKTFTFHSTQPDFTANAGCFASAIVKMPGSSLCLKMNDVICEHLNIKCDPGGRLMYTADLVGRGAVTLNSNPSGTWTIADDEFYYFEDMAAFSHNFGGAVSPVLSGGWELDLTQKMTPSGQDSGNFQTWAIGEYGGTFKATWVWNTNTMPTAFAAGTPGSISLRWGNATPGTVDRDLSFAMYGVLEEAPINHGDVISQDITLKIAGDVSAATQPITVILADAQDKLW